MGERVFAWPRRCLRRGLSLGVCAGIAGCGAPPKASAPPPASVNAVPTSVERFLPLVDKTVFAYETVAESTGEHGILVMEIRRPGADRAELAVAGHVSRVTLDATGIRHVTGGWLLKEPLSVGATFPGTFGIVKVTALDRSIDAPAGHFEGCLETVEEAAGTNFSKRTMTAFCPRVGIVMRRTEAESDEGAGAESMLLRSYGPPVNIEGF